MHLDFGTSGAILLRDDKPYESIHPPSRTRSALHLVQRSCRTDRAALCPTRLRSAGNAANSSCTKPAMCQLIRQVQANRKGKMLSHLDLTANARANAVGSVVRSQQQVALLCRLDAGICTSPSGANAVGPDSRQNETTERHPESPAQ